MIGAPVDARFADRREAGRLLARAVVALAPRDPVVLALPRGGVPVGYEVARALGAPLDVLLVRKIGAPRDVEYGIGAVVDGVVNGREPQVFVDEAAARMAGADSSYIARETSRLLAETERRRALYQARPPMPLGGRTVIVVDDGIATGGTVRAALLALAKTDAKAPARIILAVPAAPADVLPLLRPSVAEIVCLRTPSPFLSVGRHYRDFTQTGDDEVIRLLEQARSPRHS